MIECFPQQMCQDNHGHYKVPTMEGQNNIKETGGCLWDGRNYV